VSDPASAMKDANAKKRKAPAAAKGKGKESSAQAGDKKDPDAKRLKTEGAEGKEESPVKPKSEQAGSDSSVEDRWPMIFFHFQINVEFFKLNLLCCIIFLITFDICNLSLNVVT